MDFSSVPLSSWIALAATLCVTHMVQGIIGFGSIVLALPVLSFFFPLHTLIPALVVANIAQNMWLAFSRPRNLRGREAGSMLLLSLIGLPLGWLVFSSLSAGGLKIWLGGVVTVIALWKLQSDGKQPLLPAGALHIFNFVGGVVQGAFACGGPFMVIYASRALPDKSDFRATLSLIWVVHNITLCCLYTLRGEWRPEVVPIVGLALPVIVLATVAGGFLHDRIPQAPFRLLVNILLLASGLVLLKPLLLP